MFKCQLLLSEMKMTLTDCEIALDLLCLLDCGFLLGIHLL